MNAILDIVEGTLEGTEPELTVEALEIPDYAPRMNSHDQC